MKKIRQIFNSNSHCMKATIKPELHQQKLIGTQSAKIRDWRFEKNKAGEVTEHKTKQQLCKDTDEDCRSQKAEESEKGRPNNSKKETETAETKKQQELAIKCQEKEVESMISRHTHTKAPSFWQTR